MRLMWIITLRLLTYVVLFININMWPFRGEKRYSTRSRHIRDYFLWLKNDILFYFLWFQHIFSCSLPPAQICMRAAPSGRSQRCPPPSDESSRRWRWCQEETQSGCLKLCRFSEEWNISDYHHLLTKSR